MLEVEVKRKRRRQRDEVGQGSWRTHGILAACENHFESDHF